jgi:hypothetical protein
MMMPAILGVMNVQLVELATAAKHVLVNQVIKTAILVLKLIVRTHKCQKHVLTLSLRTDVKFAGLELQRQLKSLSNEYDL